MGFWAQLTEQVKNLWRKFSLWQKIMLSGVGGIALIVIIVMSYYAQQPKMEPLFTNLDPRDASAITAKLKEQKVNYKLADDGKTILVPKEDKYQLRLDVAGKVNLGGVVGFESFNETRFGETENDKRVKFLVALQGELTRTIEELDEVDSAKVHIALPQPSLFIKDQKEATASVLLRLKPYAQLKPEQVKSILAFVSHSVEGLKPQNVTVMDVNGNLLSEGLADGPGANLSRISANQLAIKQQYEQDLARSIQSMLERMRGPGKAVVRVNVTMDFDQVEKRSETYGDAVLVSEHAKEESSKGRTNGTGGNPADANMGGPSYGNMGSSGDSEYQSSERTRNYEVSKTVETKVAATGKITKVSVSVLLDGEIPQQEQEQITNAVKMAAGVDLSRGDQVSVVALPFNNELSKKLEEEMALAEKAKQRNEYIKIALASLGALLTLGLIYFIGRNLARQKTQVPVSGFQQVAAMGDLEVDLSLSPEALEKKALRTQIEKLAQTNSEDVAQVLKTWLVEE
ncbi:MAG: flagellar basal-body MS-ring/collar protein FliF [Bacillota bacterium]|uniref:Flagellar M-ring protein n=1 Tax=Thermanaerosceptrum fracticalcis TaxID=1712410 RepID=A0A7G6E120_THEFR|nr:flagellar basal-body MS-ring/collar protein FliF [Thermanaerosceptrum fracticalcis]QNB45774.1 flagellar M-ring protein FliF [Thermanaerosceptrum fracticalcis]